MSSSSLAFIEHIVLFKVKDNTESSKVNAWLNGVNGLNSLNLTLHLTVGPLLRTRSSPLAFTHLLHSRYKTKDDLAAYSAHPNNLSVVKDLGLPIMDDIMAVDWVSEGLTGPVVPSPGSAICVTFLKLKEDLGEAAKGEILEVIKGRFGEVGQFSVGENFSPARAKGYSIASVAVFKGVSEMEAVDSKQDDKFTEFLESMIVLDYVVPSPQSVTL